MIGQKLRSVGEQIAARGAFSATDFQQHGVDLIFHLDGVHHQGIVVTRSVNENYRRYADRDQHQKARCKQQDLANRPAARGIGGDKALNQRNQQSPARVASGKPITPTSANSSAGYGEFAS
jgi:hypothetical protein